MLGMLLRVFLESHIEPLYPTYVFWALQVMEDCALVAGL